MFSTIVISEQLYTRIFYMKLRLRTEGVKNGTSCRINVNPAVFIWLPWVPLR